VLRQPSQWTTLFVAILTILLWAAELRTRRMLLELLDRARELEGEDEERFAALLQPKENRKNRILSHTTAINLTYLVVFAYSAVVFVVGPEHFQPPATG
jgi:multidrug efflux pump subunit AcrB